MALRVCIPQWLMNHDYAPGQHIIEKAVRPNYKSEASLSYLSVCKLEFSSLVYLNNCFPRPPRSCVFRYQSLKINLRKNDEEPYLRELAYISRFPFPLFCAPPKTPVLITLLPPLIRKSYLGRDAVRYGFLPRQPLPNYSTVCFRFSSLTICYRSCVLQLTVNKIR
jgi:hypothetical protein